MRRFLLEGWSLWLLALALVYFMPGRPWHAVQPSAPYLASLLASLFALMSLGALAIFTAFLGGPTLSQSKLLSLWESLPALAWGGLGLALWPSKLGPPGWGLWLTLVLFAALPSEIRWLCQALPDERPFPQAWGQQTVRQSRRHSLRRLCPAWLAARWPLWLTSTLVLERMLACPVLGSDWATRLQARHRPGLSLWILAMALLWSFRRRETQ